MEDVKEEIKARLSVEDVIGDYIELKRAGRSLKGRSPWGVDKTPSFMVSPEKGIWHDFSAGKGGDIFTFLMEVEGISFREALEKLAARAGVELKKYSDGDRKLAGRKLRVKEELALATRYYQFALSKNPTVCEYVFYKRNLNKAIVKEFQIGYSPKQGRAISKFLTAKGFSKKELEDAGLLNQYGGDLFRGRMMIPFIDTDGAVIGYTARTLEKDGIPKYLNTPETIVFNKSRFIFGLYQAKPAIREKNYVVIVEGNMDVISSHQAGVKTTVATSGTAMTEQHLKILSRLTNDVRLAYDSDEAGLRATERAINLAGELGISISVISDYHGAKDPDELIQKDPKLWQAAVESPKPAVDYLLDRYEETHNLNTGQGKREYSDLAMKLISYLKDPVEKKHYEKLVAERLEVSVEDLQAKKIGGARVRRLKPVRNQVTTDTLKILEDNLLAIQLFGGVSNLKVQLSIPDDETKLNELALIYEAKYAKMEQQMLEQEAAALSERYQTEMKKARMAELMEKLAAAEDDAAEDQILREIKRLQKT